MGERVTFSEKEIKDVLSRINKDELVQLALELGNTESPTGYEGKVGQLIFDWLKSNGFAPQKIGIVEDRFSVVGRIPGDGSGLSLIFNSHMDTVMSRDDIWMYSDAQNPVYHSAWVEDGKVWGAGVVNDKGPMACWMIAAKAIKESGIPLKGDLLLSMVPGEIEIEPIDEFQGPRCHSHDFGAAYMISHGALADYALVAEATGFRLAWVEAGKLWLKITVFAGPSRYTPYYPRPTSMEESPNAIVRTAKLIEKLEEWALEYERKNTREYEGGTVVPKASIGAVRGGAPHKIYRYPELCTIYMDIRLTPETNPLDVQAEIQKIIRGLNFKAEIKPFSYRRGYEAKNIKPLAEAVERAHLEILKKKPERPGSPECSMWRDINAFNALGIPSLTYGPGGGLGGGNFFFTIEEMVNAAKIYALTALDICCQTKERS